MINRSQLSMTAKTVYIELLCNATPKDPLVLIDVKQLAERLGRAASTIRSAVRELLECGMILYENIIVHLKKVYKLIFKSVECKKPKSVAEKQEASNSIQKEPTPASQPFVPKQNHQMISSQSPDRDTHALKQTLLRIGLPEEPTQRFLKMYSIQRCKEILRFLFDVQQLDQNVDIKTFFEPYLRPSVLRT